MTAPFIQGTLFKGALQGNADTATLAAAATTLAADATLTRPVIAGVPAADGVLGYDSTRHMVTVFSSLTGIGSIPQCLLVSRPGNSLTNSVTTDQDFPAVFQIPANGLIALKEFEVTIGFQLATGVSTATLIVYVKLGTTKVYATTALNFADSVTRSGGVVFSFIGTAAPGAAVAVECRQVGASSAITTVVPGNTIAQPVAGIATNGALNVVPGLTWSATGSTDTMTITSVKVMVIN